MKRFLTLMVAVGVLFGGTLALAGGPEITRTGVVQAGQTHVYSFTFRGGEKAVVVVRGDGDTDLDLRVFDEHDNLIAFDDDPTDECVVAWTPAWTGKFTVKVVNHGAVANAYKLGTN